jgi:3-hydroxybutyryl-CoA dehydrogenase
MNLPPAPDAAASPVIGVVGLGTMGLGIAQVFAQAGHRVLVTDVAEGARDSAVARMAGGLAARVESGKMTAAARDALIARVAVVPGPDAMGKAGLVIEAVIERLDVKTALFRALEASVAPEAVLATNTSSLSVASVAAGLAHPARVLGLHFFNPAPAMRLVELIAPPGTDPRASALARQVCEGAGKVVIDAPDRPGFIVNRCARPNYGEALALLAEGRAAGEIDAAMVAAGYRLGPFSLIDLIGADINLAATEGLAAAMGGHPRYHVFAALRAQVARGDLGRKTGKGFVFPDALPPPPQDAEAIVLRIEATLANEGAWLLAEGGTTREGIDTAMKLGLNFPRGPFEVLARHGTVRVRNELARLEAQTALPGRYAPAPALTEDA